MRKRIWIIVVVATIVVGGVFFLINQGHVFDTELEKTVIAINQISNPFTLAVYTDIHHDPEKDRVDPLDDTVGCMKKLFSRCHIDAIWNLGDIINGQTTTKAEAIVQIREVLDREDISGDPYSNYPRCRSCIQVAQLTVENDRLTAIRDEPFDFYLPDDGAWKDG